MNAPFVIGACVLLFAAFAYVVNRKTGGTPEECIRLLQLMESRGGYLDDMEPETDRYAREILIASELGLIHTGSLHDTGARITPKGYRLLASSPWAPPRPNVQ